MDKFRILQIIGEGTYGKVFKAQHRETGRVVAIKKFKQTEEEDPHVRKTMSREISVLKNFKHDNIVKLREHFKENGKLFLIFDYVQQTLLELLQKTPKGLPTERLKLVLYQILESVHFLHSNRVIHRDIKPENLLISDNGVVKLCDFGFARSLKDSPNYQYTDYVSTRWYRAPELLVGDASYSTAVDVWAIGCIFAEIFNGLPLFPGQSDLHTLQLILETITADDIENDRDTQELTKKQRVAFRLNPLFEGQTVPTAADAIIAPEHIKEVSFGALLKDIDDLALDFIRKCLVIDGQKRSTCGELMEHPYFDEAFKLKFVGNRNKSKEDPELEVLRTDLDEMLERDERGQIALAATKQKTKTGKDELSEADLVSEKNDLEEEEEESKSDSFQVRLDMKEQVSHGDERMHLDPTDFDKVSGFDSVPAERSNKPVIEFQDSPRNGIKNSTQLGSGITPKSEQDQLLSNQEKDTLAGPPSDLQRSQENGLQEEVSVKVKSSGSISSNLQRDSTVQLEGEVETANEMEQNQTEKQNQSQVKVAEQQEVEVPPYTDEQTLDQRNSVNHTMLMEGSIAEDMREENASSQQSARTLQKSEKDTPKASFKLQTPKKAMVVTLQVDKSNENYDSPVKNKLMAPTDDYSDQNIFQQQRTGGPREKLRSVLDRTTDHSPIEPKGDVGSITTNSMFKAGQYGSKLNTVGSHNALQATTLSSKNSKEGLSTQAMTTINRPNFNSKSTDFDMGIDNTSIKQLPPKESSQSLQNHQITHKIPQVGLKNQPNGLSPSFVTRKGPPNQNVINMQHISSTSLNSNSVIIGAGTGQVMAPKDFSELSAVGSQNLAQAHYYSKNTANKNNSQLPTKLRKVNVNYAHEEDKEQGLKVIGNSGQGNTARDVTPDRHMPAILNTSKQSMQINKMRNANKYTITPGVGSNPSTMHSVNHSFSESKHMPSGPEREPANHAYTNSPNKPIFPMANKQGHQGLTQTSSLENLQRKGKVGFASPRKLPHLKQAYTNQSQAHVASLHHQLKTSSIQNSSGMIASGPQQGMFFVNKIGQKGSGSVSTLPNNPISLTQKRSLNSNPKLPGTIKEVDPIDIHKPSKVPIGGQNTSTNKAQGPNVYYKVMHSTYQNYHRSSNSQLITNDLNISAKKLSPGINQNSQKKEEVSRQQSNSQVNLHENYAVQSIEEGNKGFASLSRMNNQAKQQQLVTFPKLMDAASQFKMQPSGAKQKVGQRNNQTESESQLLYGVSASNIGLLNQNRSSSQVVGLQEGVTNFVSPQKFSTKKLPPQKYVNPVQNKNFGNSLHSTLRDNDHGPNTLPKQSLIMATPGPEEKQNNQIYVLDKMQEYSNKQIKPVTIQNQESNNKYAPTHSFFVGSGAQQHLPNRSYNGSVLQQHTQSQLRLGNPQIIQNQTQQNQNDGKPVNMLKSNPNASSPMGIDGNGFPRRNLVTNKLKNQQVMQQKRRERAEQHTSIFSLPNQPSQLSNQGQNIMNSSKADYTGITQANTGPHMHGSSSNPGISQNQSNLQLPALKKLQPMPNEGQVSHSSLSPNKNTSGMISSSKKINMPQNNQYNVSQKYRNETGAKLSSKNQAHQQLMIRQSGQQHMGTMGFQHTRIPSSTLSKHTGQSRTSAMAIAGASANISGPPTNSNNPNSSNFIQQVPKQYRMYLGASVSNTQGAKDQQSTISPRLMPKQGSVMTQEGGPSAVATPAPGKNYNEQKQAASSQMSQQNSSSQLKST